ncbi:MAG: S8 family serine peptidase, partial [Flavobacteriales bacterium]
MKKLILSLCLAASTGMMSAAGVNSAVSGTSASSNAAEVVAGKLVVRVHPAYRSSCTDESILDYRFQAAMQKIGTTAVRKKFLTAREPGSDLNRYGKPKTDLSLVYEVTYSSELNVTSAATVLNSSGILMYSEPLYKHRLFFNPNDPSFSTQQFLTRIQGPNAWNIEQGDTNVVIGIVDSGTDWDHPDLQANIAYNWNDPINGLDDDADGYVDNFRGWDVSENDNNPMVVNSDHGSHVSGCAAAVTNNGVGVASPGFNCRFLPVKSCLDASSASIDNGYDGVYYAAEHGCDVINCSWGRGGGPSQFEQDVMDFAVFDHDAVVVAAAGNTSTEVDQYPPAYSNVLSVASTGN